MSVASLVVICECDICIALRVIRRREERSMEQILAELDAKLDERRAALR